MSPRKRNLITGIVVLGALGTLVWMILTFSGRAMGIFKPKGTPVVFIAERADGLSDGSPVFYAGVEVGKVTAVHRQSDNMHMRIEGEIDNKPPLPHNLIGEIQAQSKLGNSTEIDLRLSGPPTGELSADQVIPIRYTGQSLFPPEFSVLMEQVNQQKLVAHVDETIKKVGDAMESIQKVVADPKLHGDLQQAMANIRLATERADKVAANLEKLTANADAAVGEVRTTLAKTDKNIDRLSRQVSENLDKLGQSFQQFQEITEKINHGKGTAGELLNDPKLYDELAATAKELNVVSASLARLVDQWEHEGVYIKMTK